MHKEQLFHMLNAAIDAAEAILKVRDLGFQVHTKSDHSPVTDADYAADKAIRARLEPTGIPLLSEEVDVAREVRQGWSRFWCIDPLDGTREFAHGRDQFAVNIALIEGEVAREGLIALPVDRLMYYTDGDHAYRATWKKGEDASTLVQRRQRLTGPDFTQPWVATVSRSYLDETTLAFLEDLRLDQPQLEVVRSGSALKFCMLLDGEAHIYPRFAPCMEWDTASGHALINRVGMELYAHGKTPLRYNRDNLVNPEFIVRAV